MLRNPDWSPSVGMPRKLLVTIKSIPTVAYSSIIIIQLVGK